MLHALERVAKLMQWDKAGFKIDSAGERLLRAETDNILASSSFVRATRLQRLLRFLVDRAIQNPDESPKEYEIGIEVFDRDTSFDPQTDAIVRVQAARLRTKLRDYFLEEGRESKVIIELPKGTYALTVRTPATVEAPPLEEVQAEAGPAPPPVEPAIEPDVVGSLPKRWGLYAAAFGAIGLCLLVILSWRILTPPHQSRSNGSIIPFADYPGDQDYASFSPDGKEIAFTLQREGTDHADVYVKLIGAGTPLRLTFDPTEKYSPQWSADGRFVAFIRRAREGQHDIYVIPSLGGAERKIAQTSVEGTNLSWAPDGRYIAFVDHIGGLKGPWGICLVSPDTGERRELTSPAPKNSDLFPAFSPDSLSVAFVRQNGAPNVTDLYAISIRGGEPRKIAGHNRVTRGVAWTSGAKELIFSSNRTGPYRLWRVPAEGGVEPQAVSEAGNNAINPSISRATESLAYTESYVNVNIWQTTEAGAAGWSFSSKLIASSRSQNSPEFSPDGGRIVFASDRSGFDEIWRCDRDGSNAVQLTHFEGPPTGTPHWSPDGKSIVFDSRPYQKSDIFIIPAEGGAVRRVSDDSCQCGVPSWSRDGRSVYASCNRTGAWQLWRIPLDGRPWAQVTQHGAFDSAESPDGKYVYYSKGRKPGIWRLPAQGGEEIAVPELNQAGQWRYWQVTPRGFYYAAHDGQQFPALEFAGFAALRPITIRHLQKGPDGNGAGLAVAPDGRTVLFAQVDQSVRDIMLVDHFR